MYDLNVLADDPHGDEVFTNQSMAMDVLYFSAETHQAVGSMSSHGSFIMMFLHLILLMYIYGKVMLPERDAFSEGSRVDEGVRGYGSLHKSVTIFRLHIDDAKPFYSSAVYAAALHSVSLSFRIAPVGPNADSRDVAGAVDVNGIFQMLAGQARQNIVAILNVAMPAPLIGGASQRSFQGSLTSDVKEDAEDSYEVESMAIHGALHSGSQPGRSSLDAHSVPMAARLRSSNAV
ncbi:hypothetical protein C5167_000504 [Papaver somniferum]|uniref:Uncharacterized protein n=1 Tax=Papaver somniferum TaxID=3469 RepID=A0A4Y7KUF1_PAPSO|nr:hypothetical protein C5167_000504 [Papaver somniferum]